MFFTGIWFRIFPYFSPPSLSPPPLNRDSIIFQYVTFPFPFLLFVLPLSFSPFPFSSSPPPLLLNGYYTMVMWLCSTLKLMMLNVLIRFTQMLIMNAYMHYYRSCVPIHVPFTFTYVIVLMPRWPAWHLTAGALLLGRRRSGHECDCSGAPGGRLVLLHLSLPPSPRTN